MELLLLGVAVLAGASTQRVTGLGFGLVSGPLLVLAIGPFTGVLLANVLALVSNLVILSMTWRDVDLRRTLLLAVPAVLAVPFGAAFARRVDPAVLAVLVGVMVLAALLAVLLVKRARVLRGRTGAVVAGAISGLMSVTAAVGGPALTIYAVSTGWRDRSFVGSLQLYFAIVNVAAIAAKGLPDIAPGAWAVGAAALVVGTAAGQLIARRISARRAFPFVVVLALVGAASTVGKGLLSL